MCVRFCQGCEGNTAAPSAASGSRLWKIWSNLTQPCDAAIWRRRFTGSCSSALRLNCEPLDERVGKRATRSEKQITWGATGDDVRSLCQSRNIRWCLRTWARSRNTWSMCEDHKAVRLFSPVLSFCHVFSPNQKCPQLPATKTFVTGPPFFSLVSVGRWGLWTPASIHPHIHVVRHWMTPLFARILYFPCVYRSGQNSAVRPLHQQSCMCPVLPY